MKQLIFFLFLIFVVINAFDPPSTLYETQFYIDEKAPKLGYRLPNQTIPLRYDLTLTTHIHLNDQNIDKTFKFGGTLGITIKVIEKTNSITLHGFELLISAARLYEERPSGRLIKEWKTFDEIPYEEWSEFHKFEFNETMKPDQVLFLELIYGSTIQKYKLRGFYWSKHYSHNRERFLATTQFEPTYARYAFPCYDEPGIRAPIALTIIHGTNYSAVSNMPVKKETVDGDYTMTSFEDTPSMPAYLLAFVVSDFTCATAESDPPQRVCGPPDAIEDGEGDFPLQSGIDILRTLDEYFGVKYTDNHVKVDQFAIPDFDAGAMENWGLVTYRTEYLLRKYSDNIFDKSTTTGIIAHEYTHFLFGNLVSVKWWRQLWLKEGFAALYGKLAVALTYPEYDAEEFFFIESYKRAIEFDEMGVTRPMNYYVEDVESINRLYDTISYPKAASVLRMFKHALSEEVWKLGLNYYLTNMSRKAATSDDLAANLEKAALERGVLEKNLSMKEVIDSWADQEGFPLIEVRWSMNPNQLSLSYYHFETIDIKFKRLKHESGLWLIPIHVSSATTPVSTQNSAHHWLRSAEELISKPEFEFKNGDWIIINPNATGYYRVNYEPIMWKLISDKLDTGNYETEIHAMTRAKLLDDAFVLAKADKVTYFIVLSLLKYLRTEKHFLPWFAAHPSLKYLDRHLTDTPLHGTFRNFVEYLIAPLYKGKGVLDLGDNETIGEKLGRATAVSWACRVGDKTCLKEANERVKELIANKDIDFEPNLQEALYCAGVRQANKDDFKAVYSKIFTAKESYHRRSLMKAIGCTESDAMQKFLMNTVAESNLYKDSRERKHILESVCDGSPKGVNSVIDFFKNYAGKVKLYFDKNDFIDAIVTAATYITTESSIKRFTAVLDELVRSSDYLTANERHFALETAKFNFQWLEKNQEEIQSFFNSLNGTLAGEFDGYQ